MSGWQSDAARANRMRNPEHGQIEYLGDPRHPGVFTGLHAYDAITDTWVKGVRPPADPNPFPVFRLRLFRLRHHVAEVLHCIPACILVHVALEQVL